MNTIEELITATLAKQAERKPHPGPILAALAGPRRRNVRPLVIGLAGTAVVTAAVAVPLAIRSEPVTSSPSVTAADRGSHPGPGVAKVDGIPMKYTLGAIPDGFVEEDRIADVRGDTQSRLWKHGQQVINLAVFSHGTGKDHMPPEKDTQRVTVNGVEGRLMPTGDRTLLWWASDNDTLMMLMVDKVPDPAKTLIHLAESVRVDSEASVQCALSFTNLPPTYSDSTRLNVMDSVATEDHCKVDLNGTDRVVTMKLLPKGKDSDPVMPNVKTVIRALADGRKVQLEYNTKGPMPTQQEQQAIFDGMRVGPVPDTSWIGKK